MSGAPASIHDHAAIGDGRSVALVTRDGTIDWLCWPRFDSSAIFSALLDPRRGGWWRIAPSGPAQVSRRYRDDTNVLETRFDTAAGTIVLTDLMTVDDERARLARPSNTHELLRRVTCERGAVEVELGFAPRPDFGRARPRLRQTRALGLRCEIGSHLYALHGDRPLALADDTATARFTLRAGEHACFALTFDDDIAAIPLLGDHAEARIEASTRWWRSWIAQLDYDGPDRAVVVRGLLAIKLLSFAPSGAVIAAPTTSLPERVGAELNWDYRFCWLRDASFTARAFFDLGFREDGFAFCSWLLHATRLTRPELRILYDVYGRPPDTERVLPELTGYRGSRPVRIYNGASSQLQLDCYGEVLDGATWLHADQGLDRETQGLLADLGTYVLAHWHLPDHGIWESRDPPQHRTHSRVLCWVALDRLARLRRRGLVRELDLDTLTRACTAIRDDVTAHGWNPRLQSYTDAYGASELDSSVLLLPYYGFESATSPRMTATYQAIEARLRAGPGLYWRNERGIRVGEGAFGICTAWVIDYLARAGRRAEARAVFDAFAAHANDVGLFGEEVDPITGDALGNFPQAYTHVGLLAAALVLGAPSELARRIGDAA
jgi:GH15 family glucan-1,4-alpha-glucosidase